MSLNTHSVEIVQQAFEICKPIPPNRIFQGGQEWSFISSSYLHVYLRLDEVGTYIRSYFNGDTLQHNTLLSPQTFLMHMFSKGKLQIEDLTVTTHMEKESRQLTISVGTESQTWKAGK